VTETPPNRFSVQVEGLEHLRGTERQVVYHGVNKSGSLVMTNLLFQGYYEANRANQFFSTYRGVPRDEDHLRRIINASIGHSFFGAHCLYGAFPARPDQQVLTTQFRNPLPRVRSCYQWLKNKADAKGQVFPSFEQWVLATRGVAHSQAVQFALGFDPTARQEAKTLGGEEMLERALTNIERDVSWFGIAEHLEESAFQLAAICGLPTLPPWQKDNRNKDRPLVTEWPQEHVELVRDVFRWDFKLYEYAVERFLERRASLRFGPELERYERACADQYKDRLGTDGTQIVDGPPSRGSIAD
jgi:hypothetical protein